MSDSGKLILRLALGLLMLLHGIAKMINGIEPIAGMLAGAGLPQWFAPGVYVGEVIAPLMLIAGWYARIAAALIGINMLFALGLAHTSHFFVLGATGGWALELQGMYLFSAIAMVLMGPGRYGINDR